MTSTPSQPPRMPRRSRARRRARAGFTIIEVMVSLSIMVLGALAVIGLQQHTIRANAHARELSTAMQIAQLWVERFKQDAALWTQVGIPNGTPSPDTVIANTRWLQLVRTAPYLFQTITPVTATASNGFDYLGTELNMALNSDADRAYYCASFRPSWVYPGRALRVDVRVWWARRESGRSIANTTPTCADNNTDLSPGGQYFAAFHTVYLSTVIRQTQL